MGNKRGIVFSGGGAKGAFSVGKVKRLIENGVVWDGFSGVSTGADLATLMAADNYEGLERIYLNTTTKDVMNLSPFTDKGELSIFKAIKALFKTKFKSIGDSKPLLKLIKDNFSEEDFDKIINSEKELYIGINNLSTQEMEYATPIHDYYESFVNKLFASNNFMPYMSLITNNNYQYGDGGTIEHVPIKVLIEDGDYSVIDVIVNRPITYPRIARNVNNILQVLISILFSAAKEVSRTDLEIAHHKAKERGIELNVYFTPFELTHNSLIFNPVEMKNWFELGYNDDNIVKLGKDVRWEDTVLYDKKIHNFIIKDSDIKNSVTEDKIGKSQS